MVRVTMLPGMFVRAVHAPGYRDKHGNDRHDWTQPYGSPANTARVGAHGESTDLAVACATLYPRHAMMAAYSLIGPDGRYLARLPRLAKDAWPWLLDRGYRVAYWALIVEGDNPGHGDWTPELSEAFAEQRRRSRWLDGALWHPTPHGWHSIWPFTVPVFDAAYFENLTHAMGRALAREGTPCDPRCFDHVHLFAPPRHTRERKDPRTGVVSKVIVGQHLDVDAMLENVRAWDPRELPQYESARVGWSRRIGDNDNARGPVAPTDAGDAWEWHPPAYARGAPPVWSPRVRTIAEACLAVADAWHPLFLALAGALCERGVAPELIPAIVGAVSRATGNDTKTEERVKNAAITTDKYLRAGETMKGAGITGYDALVVHYPGVADAVDEATDGSDVGRLERQCGGPAPVFPPRETAQQTIEDTIDGAPRGVTVVVAQCGLGKTTLAERAAARAAKRQPDAERAPPGTKTAIAVPTNDKAVEVYNNLVGLGVPARRIYSPLAHKEPGAEEFACIHVTAGRALARGGQSVRNEFCDGRGVSPCERRAVCPAYLGADGDRRGRVLVGSHALLAELAAHAGPTGRLVIDESPPPVTSERITAGELARVAEFRFAFQRRFVDACAAVTAALRGALETDKPVGTEDFAAMVGRGIKSVNIAVIERACDASGLAYTGNDPAGESVRAASRPHGDERGRDTPELVQSSALRARDPSQGAFAAVIGDVSRVLRAVHRAAAAAMTGEAPHAARVERAPDGGAVLVITAPNAPLVAVLRRDGATVVLDATPDVPVLSRLAGADLESQGRVVRAYAQEAATVSRTLLAWRGGSRAALFRRDGVHPERLASAVRAVVRWALEDPTAASLGVVTFLRAELILGYVMQPESKRDATRAVWTGRHKLALANLDECAAAVRPLLNEWTGSRAENGTERTVMLAHYGGMRGLNRMSDVDTLATVGDPWGELGESAENAKYLGVADWEAWYRRKTSEEIEQALGRLRTVWVSTNLRAMHVGTMLPSDPRWSGGVTFRRLQAHRPSAVAAMSADTLRSLLTQSGMSLRAAATALGVSKSALSFYLRGDRPIPTAFGLRAEEWQRAGHAVHRSPSEEEILARTSVDTDTPTYIHEGGKSWVPTDADDWLDSIGEPPPDAEW